MHVVSRARRSLRIGGPSLYSPARTSLPSTECCRRPSVAHSRVAIGRGGRYRALRLRVPFRDEGSSVKAAYFKEHGGPEKIVHGDYRDPAAGAGEALVRVRACALNQVDMLLLDGRFPPPQGLPHVNGREVTGTVEATGAGVRGLAAGQRVIA